MTRASPASPVVDLQVTGVRYGSETALSTLIDYGRSSIAWGAPHLNDVLRRRSIALLRNSPRGARHYMQYPEVRRVLHCRIPRPAPTDCVLRRSARRPLVTWLAWLAMAFIVVAPMVSRVLPASAPMHGMASMHHMMGSDCSHAMAGAGHSAMPCEPSDTTDRCGYCVLLDQQSLLGTYSVLYLLAAPPRILALTAFRTPEARTAPRLSARPRGPPALA